MRVAILLITLGILTSIAAIPTAPVQPWKVDQVGEPRLQLKTPLKERIFYPPWKSKPYVKMTKES